MREGWLKSGAASVSASVDIYAALLSGSGERVCVLPTASMDRPDIWLQAAGPRSHQSPQRFLLSDIRRRRQPQLHRGPHAQRSMLRICMHALFTSCISCIDEPSC